MNITVVISDTKLRVNNMYINTLEQCMHAHTDTHSHTPTHTKHSHRGPHLDRLY